MTKTDSLIKTSSQNSTKLPKKDKEEEMIMEIDITEKIMVNGIQLQMENGAHHGQIAKQMPSLLMVP